MGSLLLSLAAFVVLAGLTLKWWVPKRHIEDGRSFDDYIKDIRSMNEYNARFLEGIVIFLAIALLKGRALVHETGLILLLSGFVSGAIAMFFFPIPKPGAEEGKTRATYVSYYWLFKIILSQATVVFTVSGVLTIMIEAISRLD